MDGRTMQRKAQTKGKRNNEENKTGSRKGTQNDDTTLRER